MGKYHAGKNGRAICGSGRSDGFKTVVVGAQEWNAIRTDKRCLKCVAAIAAIQYQKLKSA